MIKITKLTIKNFLSVGNVTQAVNMADDGLTLVLGMNTDANNGVTRNGAGKSTIVQAISYALYGKPLTKIKIPNLINNINRKGLLVTLEFEKEGTLYKIERGQKPAVMKFYVNQKQQKFEEDEAQGENRHTQAEINRLVGLSHTMFKHVVALNTFTEPFLRMSTSDQRAMIEELLGVTQISSRAETLKKLLGETKDRVRDLEAHVRAVADANARIEATIRQAEERSLAWETKHEQTIEDLRAEIAAIESIDYDAELRVFDEIDEHARRSAELRVAVSAVQRDIDRLVREQSAADGECIRTRREANGDSAAPQVTRLQGEIARKERDITRHVKQIASLRDDLASVIADIANADAQDCVCCGQALAGTNHLATVIANLEQRKGALEADIAREEKEAADREREIAAIRAEIDAAIAAADVAKREAERLNADAIARFDAISAELGEQRRALDAAKKAVADLGPAPSGLFGSRDEVYQAKTLRDNLERDLDREIAKQNPYVVQVLDLKDTIQVIDYEPLNEANDLFKHQEFLHKLLTSKDSFIRKRIIEQNLAYLNTRLNHYLDKLGLPHEVKFMSDLSVEISLLGRDFDFEQLSRGEMNRVIMATSWSFRDIWESLNESLNLYFIDEVLDQGTDGYGAEAALAILKSMARDRKKNVFLISHRDELVGRIDRTLHVTKDNGFTRIVPE